MRIAAQRCAMKRNLLLTHDVRCSAVANDLASIVVLEISLCPQGGVIGHIEVPARS
jgi:hypothetical protein